LSKEVPRPTVPSTSPLLSRNEAADYLGAQPQTLAVWHSTGRYEAWLVRIRSIFRSDDEQPRLAIGGLAAGSSSARQPHDRAKGPKTWSGTP